MASEAIDPTVPPLPYVVASWLGFTRERIVEGLQRGTIAPPVGAPPGWLPPGGASTADGDVPDEDGSAPAPDDAAGDANTSPDDAAMPDEDSAEDSAPADLRETWYALAQRIDASLDEATFDALWARAGEDDASRASRMSGVLWRAVAGEVPAGDEASAAALASAIAEQGTRGSLTSLAGMGSAVLADRARADGAVLDALAAGEDLAVTGVENGVPRANTRFDPMTGDANRSDAWIDDRAKLVAWRAALRDDPAAAEGIASAWRFVDRAAGDGATFTLGGDGTTASQVVFARDGGDAVTGDASVDRLHGGDGDDVLDGAGGDDLVEGARGNDTLGGGTGADRLEGGAGDDILAGGRGNDRLAGGSGHDVYGFSRGDGVDTIVDADGEGEIVLDGEALGGDESGVSFSTEADGMGGTTLVVRTVEPAGMPAVEIRVRDWQPGDLGIHLPEPATPAESSLGSMAGAPLPDLKPYITAPSLVAESGSAAADPVPDFGIVDARGSDAPTYVRESGNESGMGNAIAFATSPRAVDVLGPATPRAAEVGASDWARALRSAPSTGGQAEAAAPPAYDPATITSSDVAGALAGLAGEHDDAEAGFASVALPWWSAPEVPPGLEPPVAPARHVA